MLISGSCQCGEIHYEAEVDPSAVGICHCTDCQKLTGSVYRVTVRATDDRFRIVSGDPKRYRKIGDSGRASDQFFCGSCGSPLYRADADGKAIGIRLGTIDQRQSFTPNHQSYLSSALPFSFDIRHIPKGADD
ncbi:GFA family protein [Peteryoungia ipomoeae]|uniref:GFA family protein n=1 Tax=Peteryoungia ipomoeae TaxID=1210932 RepID=A0A4S8P1S1_9HYPH|nr:GFA family protein [Peteryoungia ipomoeae]THV23967.1 GFA family protein [Peteryoungia ipomoeae]